MDGSSSEMVTWRKLGTGLSLVSCVYATCADHAPEVIGQTHQRKKGKIFCIFMGVYIL